MKAMGEGLRGVEAAIVTTVRLSGNGNRLRLSVRP